jgi:DNA-binding NarL/FixJ family response regulator
MHRAHGNGYPITLVIGEHNRMNCQLMEGALRRNRHLSVLASAVESTEFLDAFKNLHPDVCIVSSNLKDGATSGFRVTRELRAVNQDARVIVLLDSSEKPLVIEAFRSGALGVFSRDEPFDVLCKCIHKVHGGEVWANNQDLQFMVESLAKDASPSITDSKGVRLLTKRELSLVQLVAEGRTNRDISRELNLSEHTVRNYLFRIFNKLGTSNRLELALYVINQREGYGNQLVGDDLERQ